MHPASGCEASATAGTRGVWPWGPGVKPLRSQRPRVKESGRDGKGRKAGGRRRLCRVPLHRGWTGCPRALPPPQRQARGQPGDGGSEGAWPALFLAGAKLVPPSPGWRGS